jgi:hypothetical protein
VEVPSFGAFLNGYSVFAAPPTEDFSSRTVTRSPRRASSVAATSPLWPAPTMTTSVLLSDIGVTIPWG